MALGPTQMTIDLGGLTQWAASIGSRGLKQLATSGVQLHSLGCMLMIAELIPASNQFRRTVNRERQQQRSERFWYFKAVEVGGASNFLADQLLKTRAGENVVGLLTAITSTMHETSCTTILSLLFDAAGVSLDNTPGIGEFEKIREALLPLVRRTEFKERVAHYHYRLRSFIHPGGFANDDPYKARPHDEDDEDDSYEAMPHDKDIPNIICMLSALVKHPDHVLNYHGIIGAGWVAAYASYVLGIETCAVDCSGNTLPINGALEDSRVVIWVSVSEPDAHYEISVAGKIEQFIVLESPAGLERTGWSIDCTKLCYVDENVPGLRETPEFLCISEFVAVVTMFVIFRLARGDSKENLRTYLNLSKGPLVYYMAVFKDLYVRALHILEVLGFRCPPVTSFFAESGHNETLFTPRLVDEAEQGAFALDYVLQSSAGYVESSSSVRLQRLFEFVSSKCGGAMQQSKSSLLSWPDLARHKVSSTVEHATGIASCLAFTDWSTSLKLLSIRQFYQKVYPEIRTHLTANTAEEIVHNSISICTDNFDALQLETHSGAVEWTGLDLDGLIVLKSTALDSSFNHMRGCILKFYQGRITHEERAVIIIRSSPVERKSNFSVNSAITLFKGRAQKSRQTFTRKKNVLWLRYELLFDDMKWEHANPTTSMVLRDTYVTRPCSHTMQSPLWLHRDRFGNGEAILLKPFRRRLDRYCLGFPGEYRNGVPLNYYALGHSVEPHACSLPMIPASGAAILLQVQTCLLCTIHQLNTLHHTLREVSRSRFYYIIPMHVGRTPPSDPTSSTVADFEICQKFKAIQDILTDKFAVCPASLHTPCCANGRRTTMYKGRRTHRRRQDACVACVPRLCDVEDSCEECKEISNSAGVVIKDGGVYAYSGDTADEEDHHE
ncbi:hypothetical protein MMC18_000485 [Xylographa bjoerkii]|nr:hypothetical protein [Xylographa bjoerkii]